MPPRSAKPCLTRRAPFTVGASCPGRPVCPSGHTGRIWVSTEGCPGRPCCFAPLERSARQSVCRVGTLLFLSLLSLYSPYWDVRADGGASNAAIESVLLRDRDPRSDSWKSRMPLPRPVPPVHPKLSSYPCFPSLTKRVMRAFRSSKRSFPGSPSLLRQTARRRARGHRRDGPRVPASPPGRARRSRPASAPAVRHGRSREPPLAREPAHGCHPPGALPRAPARAVRRDQVTLSPRQAVAFQPARGPLVVRTGRLLARPNWPRSTIRSSQVPMLRSTSSQIATPSLPPGA